MRYEAIPALNREQIECDLAGGDSKAMSHAILSASLYDSDWQWAQGVCLRYLDHPDKQIRWNAVTGLSHIARIHRRLDTDIVITRLKARLNDAEIAANVEDSLSEILWWLRPER
ncbi:MAG TPA: hypothetical protein VG893_14145 [Terracidiphilus sp.]|nr:hypothetical protein [Terracidiphilus sp.]